MTTSPENLWPEDLGSIDIESPVSIIKKQAVLLGQKTANLVEGRVTAKVDEEGDNVIKFFLYAPALGDYSYKLFSLYHKMAEMYPLHEYGPEEESWDKPMDNEKELKDFLKSKFNSERTLKILRSLIAQSRE